MKATVITEIAKDGGYACYMEEKAGDFCLMGYGDTAEEAKADLLQAYEEIKELDAATGVSTPEITFEWKYDMASFFDYYSILNVSEVARKIGINASQLRRYRSGLSHASQRQYDRLSHFIHEIGQELAAAKF